ncbi:hypothetical protein CBL_13331 [Carabus blaptoides fortunei]
MDFVCMEVDEEETSGEELPVGNNSTNTTSEEHTGAGCSASGSSSSNAKCELKRSGAFIDVKVVYHKNRYIVPTSTCTTVADFKKKIQFVIEVPPLNQKVMFKGLLRDEQTLGSAGVTHGCKLMVVGAKPNDIISVTSVTQQDVQESEKATCGKEPLSQQKIHRKILDKGVPDDAIPGIKGVKEVLPPFPLSGMLNKHGGKLRLTFKLEQDQLWLGTKERTEKLAMSSIKSIVTEPIEGHEQYHLMGIQLGPTEASRYWVYWVPAQYVDAIKDAILGKWQYF